MNDYACRCSLYCDQETGSHYLTDDSNTDCETINRISCIYLQSLLRGRLFTIRIDHRNLLFIKEASNPMIVRWYMALSEFSFQLSFIRGVDNNIADAMSRLCRNNMIDSPDEYSNSRILSVISRSFKPNGILYSKIGKLHNSKVGHFGVERILKRFQANNDIWKYQRQHVKWFIDHCPCCQKINVLKIPIHAHGFTTSTYSPMDCLNIDFIGCETIQHPTYLL